MDTRRRPIPILSGGPVALQLVEPIQRNVQPVAALVLHNRDLERGFADGDGLDAAVHADAMLQMHHIVAQRQRSGSS